MLGMISAAGGEDSLSGIAEVVLALRAPLVVIVPLALLYVGASLTGRAFVGPIVAALIAVVGLGILAITLPVAWLALLGLAPSLLGWAAARVLRTPRRESER